MKKKGKLQVILFLLIVSVTKFYGAENPVNADIVVAIDGSGDYTTLQAAINAVESNSDRQTVIYIKRGLYNTEKLLVPADKKNVTLIGESRDETIISYHIYDCTSPESGNKCPAEDAIKWTGEVISTSATLTIYGDGFRAENLTIQNTAGPVGQALAIAVQSDKTVFINCNLLGYQDTIYLWGSGKRTYFQDCLVVGRTDYIYGAGIAYFQKCEIRSWGGGWITAPSTPQSQAYGYVFNECSLTYALNSPRSGDDGALVALGRPWHEYPKVTWMNSYFCDKINPLGWPTTWNMDYASTSTDLKLYEYNNNGPGADMSGRADWAGIRAMTDVEALDYTIQKVMGGSDGWDPSAEEPLIKTFYWTDSAATNGWILADNWSTKTLPVTGEIAVVESGYTIDANGGSFGADLSMTSGSVIDISASCTASYMALSNATISTSQNVSLDGKISTKDTNTFNVTGELTINAAVVGVHQFSLINTGKVIINSADNPFAGDWMVYKGTLEALSEKSLGTGNVFIASGATFKVGNDNAFHPTSRLEVETGTSLILDAGITLSEFYIDGVIQPLGVYNASTNPTLITGTGSITVGRPEVFQFIGGENGNWDNPVHYIPQLMPEAGELVISEREMETTSTVFTANILIKSGGGIRLRGVHTCTGLITMETGSKLSYATSGSGFTLNAPILIDGDIILSMNSGNIAGSSMKLPGIISGSGKVTATNVKGMECTATAIFSGDNSAFNGIWDVTVASAFATSVVAIEGNGKNAFGFGTINVGDLNKAILSHEKCAGDTLILNVSGTGRAVLNTTVKVEKFILNGAVQDTGVYNSTTNTDVFEGSGELIVRENQEVQPIVGYNTSSDLIIFYNNTLEIIGNESEVILYNVNGVVLFTEKNSKTINLNNLQKGVYFIKYRIDGAFGVLKVLL